MKIVYKHPIKHNFFSKVISKLYHLWLGFIIGYVFFNFKKINWKHLGIYMLIVLPLCYAWQLILTQTGTFPCWFFYEENILFKKPILGMVFEDIALFHPFGQVFGYILISKFKIYQKHDFSKKDDFLKCVTISIVSIVIMVLGFGVDVSSLVSLLMFGIAGIIMWFAYWSEINIYQFLKFFILITLMSIAMDYSCVTMPMHLGIPQAQGWAYKTMQGTHSFYLSKKSWMWLFGHQPLSILIVYPWSYMLFMIGLYKFLKDRIGGK